MTITAIILAHFKQREGNLKRIVDDLLSGSVVPGEIVVFIDNPEIEFEDQRVTIIRSDKSFLPKIRFALGRYFDTDYCFFIDDDLTVGKETLERLDDFAKSIFPKKPIVGFQGSILGKTKTPYANDTSIKRQDRNPVEVDVVLRTYFVPTEILTAGLALQSFHPQLPSISLDDVYLSLGNKYLNGGKNYVIGVDKYSDVIELDEAGVGQSMSGKHYENRNEVCRYLMEFYHDL